MKEADAALLTATSPRFEGLVAERSRIRDRLGVLLDRIGLSGRLFADMSRDVSPSVLAVSLGLLGDEEPPLARSASNPDALVVSLKGRGFGRETSRSLRMDFVNASGSMRSEVLQETRRTTDMQFVEWTARAPLSTLGAAAGAPVALVADFVLASGRRSSRCVDRFVLE